MDSYIKDNRLEKRKIIITFESNGNSDMLNKTIDDIIDNLKIVIFQRDFPSNTKVEITIK